VGWSFWTTAARSAISCGMTRADWTADSVFSLTAAPLRSFWATLEA